MIFIEKAKRGLKDTRNNNLTISFADDVAIIAEKEKDLESERGRMGRIIKVK